MCAHACTLALKEVIDTDLVYLWDKFGGTFGRGNTGNGETTLCSSQLHLVLEVISGHFFSLLCLE